MLGWLRFPGDGSSGSEIVDKGSKRPDLFGTLQKRASMMTQNSPKSSQYPIPKYCNLVHPRALFNRLYHEKLKEQEIGIRTNRYSYSIGLKRVQLVGYYDNSHNNLHIHWLYILGL